MKIIAIDTSCDETAAAVTDGANILSNVIWSQASLYAEFGGVMPTVAQRQHKDRIDWVIDKAIKKSKLKITDLDAIAVTIGPGLSIALSVGVEKAKEIAQKYKKPLIPINHVEGHLLSSLANLKTNNLKLSAFGLVLSGGTTLFCLIKKIGEYEILAQTQDDALGEALDKAARLFGLGYPGAPFLEKLAMVGDKNKYTLPIPLIEDKIKNRFSYSGLKSAMVRLYASIENPNKQDICDLSATFQNSAFKHVENVLDYQISSCSQFTKPTSLLFGGGVANNIEIRKRIRKICVKHQIKLLLPYTKKLNGDNAGMIGVCAYLKHNKQDLSVFYNYDKIDHSPKLSI